MERPWLSSYPTSVPADLPASEFRSLGELFSDRCKKFRTRAAFSCMGVIHTYEEVEANSLALSAYFLSHLRLQKGDRIAIMMPNVHQYTTIMMAALQSGLVVVNVNPLYTVRELEHQMKDSGAKVIFVLENFAAVVEKAQKSYAVPHIVITTMGDMFPFPKRSVVDFVVRRVKKMVPAYHLPTSIGFRAALAIGSRLPKPTPISMGPSDLAFLQYTGGTTGVSKGAMLSHGNLLANIAQAHAWVSPHLSKTQDVLITALPLYHIFSLTVSLTYFSIGGFNVLIPNPRDMKAFIKELRTHPFSVLGGVNTLFNALLNHPDFATLDFSHFKLALGGGMAVQTAVADRWKKVTGVTLSQAYGLTETSPAVCINPLNLDTFNGSIGVPLTSTWVSIRDDEGHAQPANVAGEIWVKGPQVMQGYWHRPEETKHVLTDDGWLKTGDIGFMSETGFVTIIDRKKDMIIVSGFNVYPNEIEDVVASHPQVREVAAVGVPDERSGETVKLFVVSKDPSLTEESLRTFCKEHLTGYKMPRYIEFREDLPKSNVGKVLRRLLKDPVAPA
jgi:long-chain acyl-CoA synthetase